MRGKTYVIADLHGRFDLLCRAVDVVDLTDAEVECMTEVEQRWCGDLLWKRHLQKTQPIAAIETHEPEPTPLAPFDIDAAGIAIMETGTRIHIYPGEGANADSFGGVIIDPTERELLGYGDVSCLWDRSKVVRLEAHPLAPHVERGSE